MIEFDIRPAKINNALSQKKKKKPGSMPVNPSTWEV
jgi:hypothetical protein